METIIIICSCLFCMIGAYLYFRNEKRKGEEIDDGLAIMGILFVPVAFILTFLLIFSWILFSALKLQNLTWNKFWMIK